jgi:AcrR family transcriptional regulator
MAITREKRIKKNISERVLKEKEDLRNLILDSSAKILLEKGYEKFSLRQVAENIGYSATTIYLYFKDKDELLFSVILEGFKKFYEMLTSASEKETSIEDKLKSVGLAYISFAVKNPLYYQVMFMQRGDLILKEDMNCDNTPIVKSLQLLEDLVTEAIKTGLLKNNNENDYKHYVRVIWSVTHGVASLYIAMPMSYTEKDIMEMAKISVDMSIKGLKA